MYAYDELDRTLLNERVEEFRDQVKRRLERYVRDFLARGLAPLEAALASPLAPAARGLVFQLGEGLGSLDTEGARPAVSALSADDRKILGRLGIRFVNPGTVHVPYPQRDG